MYDPYSSFYPFSSSPSLPGAWCSTWSLPQQYNECEIGQKALGVAEIKGVGDDYESLSSSNSVDLDCPEPTDTALSSYHTPLSRPKADPPGALLASCHQDNINFQSLEERSILFSSQDDAISDSDIFPGDYSPSYSYQSFCSSPKLTPLAFESNVSLEALSLCRESISNSPINSPNSTSSQIFSFSLESGDVNQETIQSCSSPGDLTEIARPNFNNLGNLDTFLDETNFLGHTPRNSDAGRDYSSGFYPHPLLLSQPDGNNTWTLSLDPTASIPETNSETSELESLSLLSSYASDHDNEAIARIQVTLPSVYSTPQFDGSFLSSPPLQVGTLNMTELNAASEVSMIVSSTSSIQQRHDEGTTSVPFSRGNPDLYFNNLSHDFPLSTVHSALNPRQPSRSNKLVKKSKDIFGRLKKLFTSKEAQAHTVHPLKLGSNTQTDVMPPASGHHSLPSLPSRPSYRRYKLPRSMQSSMLSFRQNFHPEDTSHIDNNIDEKYTYEYHARPKTLKEIKSQRRFSLPVVFARTSSRASSTKHNITTSVPRSQSRPMSMYIASQNGTLDSAVQTRNQ